MAQRTNTDGYRALIVPDPRITPDTFTIEGVAVCSEAGPRPGQAIPAQAGTDATVMTSGVQDDAQYTLTCLRGGNNEDAEYGWTATESGTTTSLRGCNMPNLAGDVCHIGGGTSSAITGGWPDSIKTRSGRVIWLWSSFQTFDSSRRVHASYTDDGITVVGADLSITLLSESDADDQFIGYTLDGPDVVCGHWDAAREVVQAWIRVVDPVNSLTQYVLFESHDEGETWVLAQTNCLVEPYTASDTLRRPIIGSVAGALCLLQPEDDATTVYTLTQFVSTDGGRSFTQLASDATDYTGFTLTEFNGRLQLAAIDWSTDDAYVLAISSAFESVLAATWGAVAGVTNVGCVALSTQHGRLYLYSTPDTHHRVDVSMSLSGEASEWNLFGHGLFSFDGAGTNLDIEKMSAVGAFGGVSLAFQVNDTSVSTTFRNHLFAIRCGGWSTFTMARLSPSAAYREGRVGFGSASAAVTSTWYDEDRTTWYPFVAPESITGPIWTASGAGTDTAGLSAGGSPYRSVSCTAGQSRYWSQTFDEDMTKGILVYFDCEIDTGGSSTANDSAVRIVLSNGVDTEYNATVRLTDAGVYIKDNVGGGTSSNLSNPAGSRRSYIVAMREYTTGSQASIAVYQARYTSLDGLQDVVYLGRRDLDPDGTPTANSSVEFGVIGAASGTIEQKWYAFHFIAASGVLSVYDPALGSIIDDTRRIAGAPAAGTPTELRSGLYLAFAGGTAKRGEQWSIAPKYDYAKEHVYPHLYASPRQKYRSTTDGTTHTFQWNLNADDTPEGMGAQAWGVALIGINFASWSLQGYDSSGSWVDILTIDNADEFDGLPFRAGYRTGASGPYLMVDATGSGSASRFIHENELAGGTVVVGAQRFKIVRNTSGHWSPTAGKKPAIFVSGWDAAIAQTGTMEIWPPNVVAIKQGLGITEYRRLRLRINADSTADGFYEIGAMVIGPAYIFGKQYSKGRVMTRTANVTLSSTTGGAKSAVRNGPTQRSVEFGWFEGIDQTDIYDLSDEPDYVTTGDAAGIAYAAAAQYDMPTMLDGLYARLNGSELPVVYVPHIPYNTDETAEFVCTDYTINGFLYGRTVGDIKVTTVIGTELVDEVVQIAAIQIQEEV